MGSIPVVGAKKDLNRKIGLGLFSCPQRYQTHLQICSQIWIGFAFLTKAVVCLQAKGSAEIARTASLPVILLKLFVEPVE